jgi:hypothetical protein
MMNEEVWVWYTSKAVLGLTHGYCGRCYLIDSIFGWSTVFFEFAWEAIESDMQ